LQLKKPDGVPLPSERTVYRVMEEIGISHKPMVLQKLIKKLKNQTI
jgi:hypothetical protein